MATHDITLPSKVRPKFPLRCVVCEKEDPGGEAKVSVTGGGSGPDAIDAALLATGQSPLQGTNVRFSTQVPACPACAKPLERRHLWKTVALYVGALGGAVWLLLSLMLLGSVVLGVVGLIAGIVGPVVWEFMHPPAFTTTPMGDRVIYEFKSERCAKEFTALNAESVIP